MASNDVGPNSTPKWHPNVKLPSFLPNAVNYQPRAWDRVPTKSNTRQGRKVWRRYQLRPRGPWPGNFQETVEIEYDEGADDSVGAGRDIKRLRQGENSQQEGRVTENVTRRYVATMRDAGAGTPKRKSAKRKSLRLSLLRSTTRKTSTSSPTEQLSKSPVKADVLFVIGSEEDNPCSSPTCKEQNFVPATEPGSSSTASAIPVILRQALVFEPINRERSNRRATVSPKKQVRNVEPTSLKNSSRRKSVSPSKLKCSPAVGMHCDLTLPVQYPELTEKAEEHEVKDGDEISPQNIKDNIVTPTCGHLDEEIPSDQAIPPNKELPQDLRCTNSVSQGELLLIDADSADLVVGEAGEEEGEGNKEDSAMNYILSKVEVEGSGNIFEDHSATGEPVDNSANLNNASDIGNHGEAIAARDQMSSRILHIRKDGEESQPPSGADQTLDLQPKPLPKTTNDNVEGGRRNAALHTNNSDFITHIAVESPIVPEEPPRITTRSIARLSDDTTVLKAFLDRAQAKKAAMDVKLAAPEDKTSPAISSRRSPRKALAERDLNSPSSPRPTKLAHRPGTPPIKQHLQEHLDDAVSWEDIDEITMAPLETQPMRRSARSKKLPVPVKGSTPTAGTLSLIPVRRADGTDPIILQKGNAQELAIMTRANTRRNKGQAKLPTFMLEELQLRILEEVEQERSVTRSQTKEARKNVGWDEKLVYFQQTPEAGVIIQPIEEKQPKIRRLRGLGGVNGTPAPKRTVDVPLKSPGKGTPAPKRRGKVRP